MRKQGNIHQTLRTILDNENYLKMFEVMLMQSLREHQHLVGKMGTDLIIAAIRGGCSHAQGPVSAPFITDFPGKDYVVVSRKYNALGGRGIKTD